MSESWHPRKTEKDVAESRYGTAKYDRGWKFGGFSNPLVHDHSKAAEGGKALNPEQLSSNSLPASYVVWTDGTTVYADAQDSSLNSFEDTDALSVMQSAVDALGTSGGKIVVKRGVYNLSGRLVLDNNVFLEGEGFSTIINGNNTVEALSTGSTPVQKENVVIRNLQINNNEATIKGLFKSSVLENIKINHILWLASSDPSEYNEDLTVKNVWAYMEHGASGVDMFHVSGKNVNFENIFIRDLTSADAYHTIFTMDPPLGDTSFKNIYGINIPSITLAHWYAYGSEHYGTSTWEHVRMTTSQTTGLYGTFAFEPVDTTTANFGELKLRDVIVEGAGSANPTQDSSFINIQGCKLDAIRLNDVEISGLYNGSNTFVIYFPRADEITTSNLNVSSSGRILIYNYAQIDSLLELYNSQFSPGAGNQVIPVQSTANITIDFKRRGNIIPNETYYITNATLQRYENSGTEAGAVAVDTTGRQAIAVSHGLKEAPDLDNIRAWLTAEGVIDWNGYITNIKGANSTDFTVVVYIATASATSGATASLSWEAKTHE